MVQDRSQRQRALGSPAATVARSLAILLVICLVECASEQGINSRGSKTPTLVEKPNGWRSQRGGSCLSYGHSCWGAHGKRSGPTTTDFQNIPDWYLMRILRRAAAADIKRTSNSDINAIYRVDTAGDVPSNINNQETDEAPSSLAYEMRRQPEAIPMLNDDAPASYKLLQIMRDASVEK